MDYILFFKDNKRFITFGIMLTFFSSFGQTFLISLYVPDLIAMLGLTNVMFGGMYATATILGALSLLYFGRLIDTVSLRRFSVLTAVLLLLSCLVIAFSGSIAGVLLGLFGLRFAGQGLLGHIALTSMSRYYEENRGKALSLSLLGYSIGEAVFPVTIGFVIGLYDWRAALLFGALIYLSLAGFAMGVGGSVKGAVLAEVYGTRYIGTIRSMFTSIGVLSTALSPIIIGWMLDAGYNFTTISLLCAFVVTGVAAISYQLTINKGVALVSSQ